MLKRCIDIAIAGIMLLLLSPLLLVVSLSILVVLGRPVLFVHLRPGLHGKPFKLMKFRTMSDSFDSAGLALPDGQRLGTLGRLLRSTSIDELPSLWNVLVGEMSLVGPRPLLMQYLTLYSDEQNRRHNVKPGITGSAQINGRNSISWQQKFELDTWYVDNQCTRLDIEILCKTLLKVLKRDDINASGNDTMPPFTGNSKS